MIVMVVHGKAWKQERTKEKGFELCRIGPQLQKPGTPNEFVACTPEGDWE